jgi:hypothetical protein
VSRRSDPARVAAIASVAWIGLGLFADAVTNPALDWDGRMTWLAHARYIRSERSVDASTLREERWYVIHPRYPALLPVAQVAVQELFGCDDDERAVRPLYAAFYLAVLGILYDAAARRAGPGPAISAVLVSALVPQLSFVRDGGAAGALGDLPLGCFLGAGLVLLSCGARRIGDGLLGGALLGGAVLSKSEGLPLALVALAVTAPRALHGLRAAPSRRRQSGWSVAAAAVGLCALLLASWKSGIADRLGGLFRLDLARAPGRLVALLPPVAREMTDLQSWSGFWLLFGLVALLGASAFRGRGVRPFVLFLALAAAVYLAAYASSVLMVPKLVRFTWNRFLVQLWVPAAVVFACALRVATGPLNSPPAPAPRA